ncbi:MAG: heparin lyase I family protein, partial [Bradymonadaceae bacterium]
YDLGSPRRLCSVAIAWHSGEERTNEFEIQTSEDGTTFTPYGNVRTSSFTDDLQQYDIRNREAKYVRIVFLGNSTDDNEWMSVTGVEIASEEEDPEDPPGSCDPAVLLHNETFEGSQAWSGVHTQFGTDYAFTMVTEPVFAGGKSGRFELRYGDPITSNGIRTEVLHPLQDHHERWYAMAMYFPSADFQPDSDYTIVSQWHQGSGSGTPTSTFRARDGRLFMVIGSSAQDPNNLVWYDIGPQTKDVWHHFVFHFVHSEGADGFAEVWHDGVSVLTVNGGNINAAYNMPRWKVGLYKSTWQKRETDTDIRVMNVDNVRMGDETATLSDMIHCP